MNETTYKLTFSCVYSPSWGSRRYTINGSVVSEHHFRSMGDKASELCVDYAVEVRTDGSSNNLAVYDKVVYEIPESFRFDVEEKKKEQSWLNKVLTWVFG